MKAIVSVSTSALMLTTSVLAAGCSQTGPNEGSFRRRLAPEFWPASTDDSHCECLLPYQDAFETSGEMSVIKEAIIDCFSYDSSRSLYNEVHCLPVYFDYADDSYPSIEVAYECFDEDNCRTTGFIIPRFSNIDGNACTFEFSNTFEKEKDSRYFGCVHDEFWSLLPFE
jgi:hypothetical protein